jgi:hypothetical protein
MINEELAGLLALILFTFRRTVFKRQVSASNFERTVANKKIFWSTPVGLIVRILSVEHNADEKKQGDLGNQRKEANLPIQSNNLEQITKHYH